MFIAHQSSLRTKLTQDPIKILYSNITYVSLYAIVKINYKNSFKSFEKNERKNVIKEKLSLKDL